MTKINDFKILDLFCGAGGFSYGMHRNEHFKTVVALDFNAEAANTFKMNMPEADVITGDITKKEVRNQVLEKSRKAQVNMIIGGPPCQGFAMKGKKLGLDDERNFLFREYLAIVEELRPEVFVIENVKRILTSSNGWFRDEILNYIKNLGYSVNYGVLNALNYGVPQSRERAFFICSLTRNILLPDPQNKEVTVRDAISDLAYLESGEGAIEADYACEPLSDYQIMMRTGSNRLFNHQASRHSEKALYKLSLIPPEKGQEYLPTELRGKQIYHTTWCRLVWDTFSPTIDTRFDTPSNGTNSHPVINRSITPREAARLQSFDDTFVFYGNKGSICKQIGNAVPPLLSEAIANSIYDAYNGEFADQKYRVSSEGQLCIDLNTV